MKTIGYPLITLLLLLCSIGTLPSQTITIYEGDIDSRYMDGERGFQDT